MGADSTQLAVEAVGQALEVLNARRHGSGFNTATAASSTAERGECSTPEGMGADSTRRKTRSSRTSTRCAQRPKAWERIQPARPARPVVALVRVLNARRHGSGFNATVAGALSPLALCSTPEGMGADSTPDRRRQRRHGTVVLNARRHGSGFNAELSSDLARSQLCSTPEGMGADSTPMTRRAWYRTMTSAQRPKAWERIQRTGPRSPRPRSRCAQRPKAWERIQLPCP